MAINQDTLSAPNQISAPRLRVLTNGQEIPGAITTSVHLNNAYHAATCHLEFAASAAGFDWWDSLLPPVMLDVQACDVGMQAAGFDPVWTSIFTGEIDTIDTHPANSLVVVDCRDLTARLIDTKIQAAYRNLTSSEIVTQLATNAGLTPVVTATTTMADRYYQQDHDRITLNQFSRVSTAWDLAVFLAQREAFDVWVEGVELHFAPRASITGEAFVVQWVKPAANNPVASSSVQDLRCRRSLTFAKDIEVAVRSWRSADAAGFTKTVRAIGAKNAAAGASSMQSGMGAQRYVFVIPNLTEDQALQKAREELEFLTRNERNIDFRMPYDQRLTVRTPLQLTGRGAAWDMAYYVDGIDVELSMNDGLLMSVRAKNHDTRSMSTMADDSPASAPEPPRSAQTPLSAGPDTASTGNIA